MDTQVLIINMESDKMEDKTLSVQFKYLSLLCWIIWILYYYFFVPLQ